MSKHAVTPAVPIILALSLALGACGEPIAPPQPAVAPSVDAVKFWDTGASVTWNDTARKLIAARRVTAVFPQGRYLAYLSIAQYNAIVAAEDAKGGGTHASVAAAAAGASVVVLKEFFPDDAAMLEATLAGQRSEPRWPGEQNQDFALGEAIGREVGAQVVAYSRTDEVGLAALPPNPGQDWNWKGTRSVLGHYGARTMALSSGDQFRPEAPPEWKSPEFVAALAEVKLLVAEQHRPLVQRWAPQGPAWLNGVATEMIVAHRRSEREAARILALANIAAFDVMNACFDAKLTYYFIRPAEADPTIRPLIAVPIHPSYPSGHSCITASYATILGNEFPQERERLEAMVEEAGMSRMLGGLHYRFDLEAGQELGRQVAGWVLQTAPKGHRAIPLDWADEASAAR